MNLTELKPAPYSSRAFLPASITAGWDWKKKKKVIENYFFNLLIQCI